jgi:anti-anti-sigma factor
MLVARTRRSVRRARSRPAAAGSALGPAAGALAVKRRRYEDAVHLIVSGELDRVTACQLRHQCERVDHQEIDTVLLDLADVTFMDSSGLQALLGAYAHSGERLVLIIGPACARTIDIASARHRLPIIEG